MSRNTILDGNEAVAQIAYKLNEVIAIYPITPSSPMGEWADQWASEGRKNLWGFVPSVVEMQSEGGAAGALHGALQTGALSTTFTASQGLLLMIPNMYKIAGELTSTVIHVAARSLAAQGLSIFCDHSDVMAARQTGFVLLCSNTVQEAHDFALISQAASLKSRLPILHFFDGFRTSHEIMNIEIISDEVIKSMIDEDLILEHRARALTPDHPFIRGTAQNPDIYFQARETVNLYYDKLPDILNGYFDQFAKLTGRRYRLYEYYGAPDAEELIVMMGSGSEAVKETVDELNRSGKKTGLLMIRLYRPFRVDLLLDEIPKSVTKICVLDRTKEPGSAGEPLYLDVVRALYELVEKNPGKKPIKVIGGRYGLSSKEFTPSMVVGIFNNLESAKPINGFTVGIEDDVSHLSIEYPKDFYVSSGQYQAMFYGLGSDGTVGANKNSIKIIGENTGKNVQGFFVYDSKKAGSVTISHLRYGENDIRSTYLIQTPDLVACHMFTFVEKFDLLEGVKNGGVFLLNSPFGEEEIEKRLPAKIRKEILNKKLRFYIIDASKVAKEAGLRGQINTIMQTCFFAVSEVMEIGKAKETIKKFIEKSYGKRGAEIVTMNNSAVDKALENLFQVDTNRWKQSFADEQPFLGEFSKGDSFVKETIVAMVFQKGDSLPVSKLPEDGTYPVGTTKYEKRNIALDIPVWDPNVCIQCGKCSLVCPHAVIRMKAYEEKDLNGAPSAFKSTASKVAEFKEKELKFTIQVSPEDCTGCGICVDICPAKNKSETRLKAINMTPINEVFEEEKKNWEFFETLPYVDRSLLKIGSIRQQQFQEPLFEFSGACAGCGETPYIKLATQLFGDRMVVANATGCSSIYGGNLPTTPYTKNAEGRGPAWSNSLFEDNAEFGLGFRLSIDKKKEQAEELLKSMSDRFGGELVNGLLESAQTDEAEIFNQRERVATLKVKLTEMQGKEKDIEELKKIKSLYSLADYLVKKSVWIIGGDGWGYDIGFGGLDHVLASGKDVNILLLDTEVYSNTGGQMSKSTPRSAVAKFASGGKPGAKKDMGLIAMSYGSVYVASVAMGAKDEHTLKSMIEAERYPGTSIILAYSHCIAHGIHMTQGMQHQKNKVDAGQWLLYRYNPERKEKGENPLEVEFRPNRIPLEKYLMSENRFKMLAKSKPEVAKKLHKQAEKDVEEKLERYKVLAGYKEPETQETA